MYYRPLCICRKFAYRVNNASNIRTSRNRLDLFIPMNTFTRKFHPDTNDADKDESSTLSFIQYQQTQLERGKRCIVLSQKPYINSMALEYCQKFGDIKSFVPFQDDAGVEVRHRILLEYADEKSIQEIHQHAEHFKRSNGISCQSRDLIFHTSDRRLSTAKKNNNCVSTETQGGLPLKDTENSSLSEQIDSYYQASKLSSDDKLRRYYVASSLEELFQRLLPNSRILLFGSSVSGLGSCGSDIDVALYISRNTSKKKNNRGKKDPGGTLLYHNQMAMKDDRYRHQNLLQLFSQMLRTLYPAVMSVTEILSARVPIIRFHHTMVHLQTDVAVDQSCHGAIMSEILRKLGLIDERFCSLVFVIRTWAKNQGLMFDSAGPWPSNFILTLLVVYYLQQLEHAVLPPLKHFIDIVQNTDKGVAEDGSDVKYKVLPLQKLAAFKGNNNMTTEQILRGFFELYASFDFDCGISVFNGSTTTKDVREPMLIHNPLEPSHNCSRNVIEKYSAMFQVRCLEGLEQLDNGCRLHQLFCQSGDCHVTQEKRISNGSIVPNVLSNKMELGATLASADVENVSKAQSKELGNNGKKVSLKNNANRRRKKSKEVKSTEIVKSLFDISDVITEPDEAQDQLESKSTQGKQ